jgi:hypothetical protein
VTGLWWYIALFALLGVVRPGPLILTGRSNPLGVGPQWLSAVHQTGYAGLVLFIGLGMWVVVARWRSAGQVERAQLKWFFAGAAWVLVIFLVNGLFPGDVANPVVNQLANIVVVVAFWGLPLAVVIAITRYHLFDIDQIVSRTVGYTLVAGVLGVVYAASVVGLQAILPVGGSNVAVAGSTLAAAALFGPVHGRVQRVVDRQFNRARYEIASVTYDFATRIRREVDINTVSHNLRFVVNETMQPASVDLWLRTLPATNRGRRSVKQSAN